MSGSPLFAWLEAHQAEAVRTLEALVNQDSGTYDREDVNRLAEALAPALRELGFEPRRFPQERFGDHWLWERPGRGRGRLLLVSHLDTVFPRGTARARPFTVVPGDPPRATGPGVLDMKGGIVVALYALRALRATDSPAWRDVTFAWVWNSDEEVLSPTSRLLIRAEASRASAVLVTEPARPGGEYVVARKGAGRYILEVWGKAAHAGAQPEVGRSAVWAMARKIEALHALTDPTEGTTVNVGVVRGGERANVVPDYCYAEVDLRVWTPEAAARAEARFREVATQPHVPDTTGRLVGELAFPPWPPDLPGTRALLELVQAAGRELGLGLRGIATGGGSDGNHTAALAPTLDGFGPKGSFAHSPEEYIVLPTLLERAKVAARFVELWAAGGSPT